MIDQRVVKVHFLRGRMRDTVQFSSEEDSLRQGGDRVDLILDGRRLPRFATQNLFHLMPKIRRGKIENVEVHHRIHVEENDRDNTKEKIKRRDWNRQIDESRKINILNTIGNVGEDQRDATEEKHARDLFIDTQMSMTGGLFKLSNLFIRQSTEDR